MAATLGQLGSGTFGAFSTQDLAPPKPKAPKSLDEQLVESAEAETSMVKEKEKGQAQEKATLAKGEETLAKETAERDYLFIKLKILKFLSIILKTIHQK